MKPTFPQKTNMRLPSGGRITNRLNSELLHVNVVRRGREVKSFDDYFCYCIAKMFLAKILVISNKIPLLPSTILIVKGLRTINQCKNTFEGRHQCFRSIRSFSLDVVTTESLTNLAKHPMSCFLGDILTSPPL